MRLALRLALIFFVFPLGCKHQGSSTIKSNTTTPSNEGMHFLEVNGIKREYMLYLPENGSEGQANTILLFFHGTFGKANEYGGEKFRKKLNNDYILVYPQGLEAPKESVSEIFTDMTEIPPTYAWNHPNGYWHNNLKSTSRSGPDDVAFVEEIVKKIKEKYLPGKKNVDIYAMGYSSGGFFAYYLSTQMKLNGIVPISSALPENIPDQISVPILHFHGDADSVVSYQFGRGSVDAIAHARCQNTVPNETKLDSPWVMYEWSNCSAITKFIKISGKNHSESVHLIETDQVANFLKATRSTTTTDE